MEIIGTGRTAEVYAYGEDRALKLFLPGYEAALESEYAVAAHVAKRNVGAPFVYDQVEIDGRKGIVYERIQGETMLSLLERNPMAIRRTAHQMAEMLHTIHSVEVEGFPSLKARLTVEILDAPILSDAQKQTVIDYMRALPDGNRLLHMDFHPDNIMLADGLAYVIDWNNACCGNPCADVCRTSVLLTVGALPPDASDYLLRALTNFRASQNRQFLAEYRRLAEIPEEDILKWLLPIATARLSCQLPGEEEGLMEIIELALGNL